MPGSFLCVAVGRIEGSVEGEGAGRRRRGHVCRRSAPLKCTPSGSAGNPRLDKRACAHSGEGTPLPLGDKGQEKRTRAAPS